MDLSCAQKLGLHVSDTTYHVELVDGTFVRPYGFTKRCHFEFASTAESLKFYVIEARRSYEVFLGLNWLRAVDAEGKFGE